MANKYKLINVEGQKNAFQIVALKDFVCQGREVKAGDKGGFVATPWNLSQKGTCWLFDNAVAIGESRIEDDACMSDDSFASQFAVINRSASLSDSACAMGHCLVTDSVKMLDASTAKGSAEIHDISVLSGDCEVGGFACVLGKCTITGNATVTDRSALNGMNIIIAGDAYVGGDSRVENQVLVLDKAVITGNVKLGEDCIVCGDTKLEAHEVIGFGEMIGTPEVDIDDFLIEIAGIGQDDPEPSYGGR